MTNDDAAPEHPAAPQAYTCESIRVLEGLEAVRLRPGMYIGDTSDGSGLHHLARELIDSVLDQHLEDRCFRLAVTIHRGGALTVEDDGPGIPVEPTPRGTPLEVIFTRLHGAISERWYRAGAGLHGVGIAAVNAVCEQLVVEVRRGGRVHRFSCRRGRPEGPIAIVGRAESTGTRITLHPDPLIFRSTVFDGRRVLEMLRPLAFLHPGLRIELTDERPGGLRETLYGRGIAAWVALLGEGQDGYPEEPLRLRAARHDVTFDVALRWSRGRRSCVRVFANDYEVAPPMLARGIANGVKKAARRAGVGWKLGDGDPGRLTEGLLAIADLRGPSLDFRGSFRDTLDRESERLLRATVAERLAEALKRRPELLHALTELAVG